MTSYYDMDGNPVELLEWANLFEHADRIVGRDERCGVRVSTVWLGMDHGLGRYDHSEPPLIYETKIFGGPHDQYTNHYPDRQQAEAGHQAAVKLAYGDN